MSLLRRGSPLELAVHPGEVRPTEEVQAVLCVGDDLAGVRSAKLELGYVNTFNYHWAGRRDAAARHDDASLATVGQVGTSHGSARDTTEWVGVLTEELPLRSGQLEAGERRVGFRVPSWAPGTGKGLVSWAIRLTVDRKGRDINQDAGFVVLVPAPAEVPELRQERLTGEACNIDIAFEKPCWKAGEPIRGAVTLTPNIDVPQADVAMILGQDRLSHPVAHAPSDGQTFDGGNRTQLDKQLIMAKGVPTTLPFEVPLPADSPPTAEAVNSSVVWYVQARIMYKGLKGPGMDRVRRELVVYTA